MTTPTDPFTERPGWDADETLDEILAETRTDRAHEAEQAIEPGSAEPWPWWWH